MSRQKATSDEQLHQLAVQFLHQLSGNVSDWYEGEIDWEAFCARQCTIWDSVFASGPGVKELVVLGVSQQMPPPPRLLTRTKS